MSNFQTLNDLPQNLSGKTVLLRADLNVPVQQGKVTDTTRIDRLKPTIDELKQREAKIIILSHFGRPKGQINPEFSLAFLTDILSKRWNTQVTFETGNNVVLLENLRFNSGEEDNDSAFAKQLAEQGDYFVNDAFSVSHRAHASVEAITRYLPSYAGRLMEMELKSLSLALETPERPVTAVVGGAKISTKLELLSNLIKKVDTLILGGGMANTFLKADGLNIGKSLCENDMLDTARQIMKDAKLHKCNLVLPVDVVIADEFKSNSPHKTVNSKNVPDDKMILDAGEETIKHCKELLDLTKTLVWNGPMGAFELEPFNIGTDDLASYAGKLTKQGKLLSVAGGGDTVSALEQAGAAKDFTYISTAGGAFLEWLEGKKLPGVAALKISDKAA